MGLNTPRTMSTQTLMYEEIRWNDAAPPTTPLSPVSPTAVAGRPTGVAAGMPYWEFTYEVSASQGLVFTALNARDTQSAGSTEPIAERLDFTDLKYALETTAVGTLVSFDMAAGFSHPNSRFEFRRNGSRFTVTPPDPRFQYGFYLKLVNDIPGANVQLSLVLAAVFRGAANDFDPGSVPWALDVYPQIGWRYDLATPAGSRVRQFRGSVRTTCNNYMSHAHEHGGTMPAHENLVGFYTDSNTSMTQASRLPSGYRAVAAWAASLAGGPLGWSMVFDYNLISMTRERELVGVYGYHDTMKYSPATPRRNEYVWPNQILGPYRTILVEKANRQGQYDNIHLHAKMPALDSCGNIQIHAPFCGHSCIHMHWRWSAVSANGAGDRGWQYKGWGLGAGAQGHTTNNAPLIPPNQRLTVAICQPGRTRHSDAQIVPPGGGGTLDVLRKMIWYCADIFSMNTAGAPATLTVPLNPGEQQVILEQGLGWAYRYSTPAENPLIGRLATPTSGSLPSSPTQQQISDFFETYIYPFFRYFDTVLDPCTNQVPEGSHDQDLAHQGFLGSSAPRVKMEDL